MKNSLAIVEVNLQIPVKLILRRDSVVPFIPIGKTNTMSLLGVAFCTKGLKSSVMILSLIALLVPSVAKVALSHFFKPSQVGKGKRYNKRARNEFDRYFTLSIDFWFSVVTPSVSELEIFKTYDREQYFCH